MILKKVLLCAVLAASAAFGQDKNSYAASGESDQRSGPIDVSRLMVNHSLTLGMGTSFGSSLQSQSMYNTMLTYQFASPVTMSLNFGLPIYSTFSSAQNLTAKNLTSAQYFKSMPIDLSLSWKPLSNLFFQVNVVRNPQNDYFSGMYSPFYYQQFPMKTDQNTALTK
jgi:hypothetical protein